MTPFLYLLLFFGHRFSTEVRDIEIFHGREIVAGEVLVSFREIDPQSLAALADNHAIGAAHPAGGSGWYLLRSATATASELVQNLGSHPKVRRVEPNYIIRISSQRTATPRGYGPAGQGPSGDPRSAELWALQNLGQAGPGFGNGTPRADIEALKAWQLSTGDQSIVAGVLDTGIDCGHPDLGTNCWRASRPFTVVVNGSRITCAAGSHGFDAINMSCNPADENDHGTHVSGSIGATGGNGTGIAGVNWKSSILGLKVLDATGRGTVADAIAAIQFAIQVRSIFGSEGNVRVLYNGWETHPYSQALLDGILDAGEADILLVAAAGNSSADNDVSGLYPANYKAWNLISVAATNNRDELSPFSNYGRHSVHLGAPGSAILSTTRHGYAYFDGTAMAAAQVAGAAALVLSRCPEGTARLKEVLLASTEFRPALADRTSTGGRLNVFRAISNCAASARPAVADANIYCAGGTCANERFSEAIVGVIGNLDPAREAFERTGLSLMNPNTFAVTVIVEFIPAGGVPILAPASVRIEPLGIVTLHVDEIYPAWLSRFTGKVILRTDPDRSTGVAPRIYGVSSQTKDGQNYSAAAIAQNQKRVRFEYPGMSAFIQQASPFGWSVQDFAAAVVNPNPTPIWVQVTLISDDPAFEYPPTSVCPNARRVCTGPYFGPRHLQGYSKTERLVGSNWNFTGLAFPGLDDEAGYRWQGTVVIESVALDSVPAQPFYSFDPAKFTVSGFGPTPAKAYHKAWKEWAGDVPAHWDEDLKAFVVPYANFWHNWDEWIEGWQTHITLTNNSGVPVDFRVDNHTYSGGLGTVNSPCPSDRRWDGRQENIDVLQADIRVDPGSARTFDLFRSQLLGADIAAHTLESVLFIHTNQTTPAGLVVRVRVLPNPSGRSFNCDVNRPAARIVTPAAMDSDSGAVLISGTACDNVGVASVVISLAGRTLTILVNNDLFPSQVFRWNYLWNRTDSAAGEAIEVTAYDSAGNASATQRIRLRL